MAKIESGTSGWRAVPAEDFTFKKVRLVAAAVAELVGRSGGKARLIVGNDTRFPADGFALECAELLSAKGVQAYYGQSPTPTPAVAYQILRRKTDERTGPQRGHYASHRRCVARAHEREDYETPGGFKYIGELIKGDKIIRSLVEAHSQSDLDHAVRVARRFILKSNC